MYQLKFWQKDNTYRTLPFHDKWVTFTDEQRKLARVDAKIANGSIFRKIWSLRLPGGIRIQIVRLK